MLLITGLVFSVLVACSNDKEEETASAIEEKLETEKQEESTALDEARESLEDMELPYEEVPFGWTEEKFVEVQNHFGDMPTIESINREIVQMTSQKIESEQIRELLGDDAPTFPFTPAYPSSVGNLDIPSEYAALTRDNLTYLKEAVNNLDLDGETNKYYQVF